MSFFPTAKVANMAANDFLEHPMLMMAQYMEISAAATALANSGQLNLAARKGTPVDRVPAWRCALPISSVRAHDRPRGRARVSGVCGLSRRHAGVQDLAETLALAPAACLDYFDAEYSKIDEDGQYAGFTLSGHFLRNESILDESEPEHEHLPLRLMQPLAVIQVALVSASQLQPVACATMHSIPRRYARCTPKIVLLRLVRTAQKHNVKLFLQQPVVHSYLRKEWVGGGVAELLLDPPELKRVVLSWVFSWPFILVYHVGLMLLTAAVPPIKGWYTRKLKFHQMQTHERTWWGLAFLPSFNYFDAALFDLLAAIAFTFVNMMPFRVDGVPVFGTRNLYLKGAGRPDDVHLFFDSHHTYSYDFDHTPWAVVWCSYMYMLVHSAGALVEECGMPRLQSSLF